MNPDAACHVSSFVESLPQRLAAVELSLVLKLTARRQQLNRSLLFSFQSSSLLWLP